MFEKILGMGKCLRGDIKPNGFLYTHFCIESNFRMLGRFYISSACAAAGWFERCGLS